MEPGVVRFDLLRQTDDSTRFLLFEVYRGPEDQNYHKQTPHYKRWTEIAEPMLAEPRTRIYYQSALPGESGWE
jgi:autoinducer 2-degrading protein